MSKRTIAWMLIACMAICTMPAALAEGVAATDDTAALPEIGTTLHGFEVIAHGTERIIAADTLLLEHEKTGAQVYFVRNDDINRTFDIAFRTPALDNTGVPHVYEHATVSGSTKYPSPNIFFSVDTQTYNTFVNAMTMPTYTTYPVMSLSQEQLLTLSDVYLDGVFNPLLLTEERLMKREAWRYALEDKDAPLTITGTVYNEMKGARTQSRIASHVLVDTLYPGAGFAHESGGDPAFIPDMTYDMLLSFHENYYHPSNSLTVLYGDLEIEGFLALLDGYFSQFDRKEITLPMAEVPSLSETVRVSMDVPAEPGSSETDATEITYGFALPGITAQEGISLSMLASILSHESSPLMTALREALPSANISISIDGSFSESCLAIRASGINASDEELFVETVDATLATIEKDGIDKDIIDVVAAMVKFETLLMPDTSQFGLYLVLSANSNWARYGGFEYFNLFLNELDSMPEYIEGKHYDGLLTKHISQNAHRAIVTAVPSTALAEENATAFEAEMAAHKAAMTDEELEALIQEGKDLEAFSTEAVPQELVRSIQALDTSSLPEEVEHYAVEDSETEDGVRLLTSETGVSQIGMARLLLDASAIPVEDMPYLMLYGALAGNVSTKEHSREEIALRASRYANGITVSPGMVEGPRDVHTPSLFVGWSGLTGEQAENFDLLYEILFESDYAKLDEVQSVVSRLRNQYAMYIKQDPMSLFGARLPAYFEEHAAYDEYIGGFSAYEALSAIDEQLKDEPDVVIEKLLSIQETLHNKQNATILFASDAEGIADFTEQMPAFFAKLPSEEIVPADLSTLPRPVQKEALAIDSQVQYNLVEAPFDVLGVEYSAVLAPMSLYLDDTYLIPKLRHGLGAYGAGFTPSEDSMLLYSYRDPNIAKTYEAYEGIADYLREASPSQEELDGYIMRAYSSYALPQGALGGALSAMSRHLVGKDAEDKLERMREIKTFSPETLVEYADAFDKLMEAGAYSTSGSATAIDAEAARFDVVIPVE